MRILNINGLQEICINQATRSLIYQKLDFDSDIWRAEIDSNRNVIGAAQPFLYSTASEQFPRYSPDGSQVLFDSDYSGIKEMWICDSSGANQRQLTFTNSPGGDWDWSPDGKRIVYRDLRGNDAGLHFLSPASGIVTNINDTDLGLYLISFSSDGKWIYGNHKIS